MEGLSDECRAAPKYGANGRQLLLEAASRLVEEEDFVFARPAPPGFNAKKKLESAFRIRDAGALYEAIPNDEKPFVPYNPRAKLPRYNRQTSVESLTGKYLVLILELVDAAERKALQIVKQDSVLRKAAIAAALAHEEELYAPASTKMAYLSAVAHARADESFIPGDCLHQVKATHCKQGTAPGKGIKSQDHADVPGRQQGSQHGRKRPRSPVPWAREDCDSAVAAAGAQLGGDRTETSVRLCFGSSSDSESESKEAGEPDDASQGQDAPPSSTISMPWKKREKWLEDAENNLSDGELHYTPPPRERSSRTAGERRKGEADDERQTCGPPLAGLPGSDILSRKDVRPDVIQCGRPTGGMDGLSHEQSEQAATPAGHCHRNPSMLPQGWESPDAEKSAAVREQVVRFVRGVLKPFFKASIVSKEMYKEVAKKSVDKVMGAHSRDSDASFLIHESERIRKLIEQYIEYCKFGKVQ